MSFQMIHANSMNVIGTGLSATADRDRLLRLGMMP